MMSLVERIEHLPPEKREKVERFLELIESEISDEDLTRAAMKLSEPSLANIWDNERDAAYDRL